MTAPAIPEPATSMAGNGVGIAVSTATKRPFPRASPRLSRGDPWCCMRPVATPKTTPTGIDMSQPTGPVSTVPLKSIESTATTTTATNG